MHKQTCYIKGVSTNGYDIKFMPTRKVNSWLGLRNFTVNSAAEEQARKVVVCEASSCGEEKLAWFEGPGGRWLVGSSAGRMVARTAR
jgi:hypothetical protein